MQYKVNNKVYQIPDKEIAANMRLLEISKQEAIEMWLDDHDILINETAEQLTAKAKANGVAKEMTRCKSAKKTDHKRERKPDPTKEEIIDAWKNYRGAAQELELPHAPKQFLNYFEEDNRPQAKLDRNLEGGMAVSIGRLREDTQYDYKFVCLSHNTLRSAAGGAVLLAEILCAEGYIEPSVR